MHPIDRRSFLKNSAASVAVLSAAAYSGAGDKPGEKIVLAVAGVRSRGKDLIRGFSAFDDVEIAYICDPDNNVVSGALAELKKRQSKEPKVEKDFRHALEDKNVTALVVAAPDHWHAPATIWACQAGKHVYVEKPCSHNLREGRLMVDAARKHDRIVQMGVQRRSASHSHSAAEFVHSGKLGKVPFVRTWITGNRPTIGKKADSPVPESVDYDLWLGAAPERPFNANRFHYNWHWNWDYGTGELGNNGIHALDLARLVVPGLDDPLRITAGGGKYFYDDDQQTPDTLLATFDFANTCVSWEHRIWAKTGIEGEAFGVIVYGEKGTLVFDKKGWHVTDGAEASDKAGEDQKPHLRNFLDCIKSGKRPNADIEQGHLSTRLCHLGNIAYRTGRALKFDAKTETIMEDAEANKLIGRTYRKGYEIGKV
jgi:predicted dehydrogenase